MLASPAVLSAFGIAIIVVLLTSPLVRRIATALGWVDRPDAGLKPHEAPVPYLGGVAIFCGWMTALVVTLWRSERGENELVGIAFAGTILMLAGLVDDIRHVRPALRLLVQAGAAGILLYAGVGRHVGAALLEPLEAVFPELSLGGGIGLGISALVCAVILVGATNATNLIDGLDGLCAGVSGISALGFFLAFDVLEPSPRPSQEIGFVISGLCAAVGGACLAFLVFNFHPATMFMGDSGSLLVGFVAAVIMILFIEHASWRGMLVALTVFGFPVFDTGLAVGRRWINGRPLFVGDRSHFYDQIRDRGHGVRRTVLACYGLGFAFALTGLAMARLPAILLWSVGVAIPVVLAVLCRRFGMLRVDDAAARSAN